VQIRSAVAQPGTHPFKSSRPDRVRRSAIPARKELFPDLTPIRLTFTLALELSAGSTHASAALRAHAIQNAGHHIGFRLGCSYSDEPHTHLRITMNARRSVIDVHARPTRK
jgi:hypothetical protein